MGIQEECDQLQSILSQALNFLVEAKNCANHLSYCPISEQDSEIYYILDICHDGLSSLRSSQSQIELIQAMIGTPSFFTTAINLGIPPLFALKVANIPGDAWTTRNVITSLTEVKADADSFDAEAARKQLSSVWLKTALGDQGELAVFKMLLEEDYIDPTEIVIKPKNFYNKSGRKIEPDFYCESHNLMGDAKAWKAIIKSRDFKNLEDVAKKYADYFEKDGEVRLYFPRDTYEQHRNLLEQLPSAYGTVKIRKLPMPENYQDLTDRRGFFYTFIKYLGWQKKYIIPNPLI